MRVKAHEYHHLYNTKFWRDNRLYFLRKNPLCKFCEQVGRVTAATVVDHIKAHKGDVKLFKDKKNWQPLCQPCHDRHKAIKESRGIVPGSDLQGNPTDPDHHWNKE